MIKFSAVVTLIFLFPAYALGADYNIERHADGPFTFTDRVGFQNNEGSTLIRESILFNDPTCPIKIQSHKTEMDYDKLSSTTSITAEGTILAMEIRTILYDVFGQHMRNLSYTEARDFNPGSHMLSGRWNASGRDTAELLTTVTYVSRVRLSDGSQWAYDADNLVSALSSLNLEQKIGEQNE